MSTTATQQQRHSRDAVLAAFAEACRQLGQADETPFNLDENKTATRDPSNGQSRSAELGPGASRGRLVLRRLLGLLAVGCIGVAAFAWTSPHGQAVPETISSSLVSMDKTQLEAQPAPTDASVTPNTETVLPQPSSEAQATPQRSTPIAPTVAPMASDLLPSTQMMAHELEAFVQMIDQLKMVQTQMARENAELAEHLKATQEIVRHNAELTEDLKATQVQMARDNVNLAGQLKASQEQVARLVASEQKQRPRTLASSPITIGNSTIRPVPTPPSPLVRVQRQDPRYLPPKQ